MATIITYTTRQESTKRAKGNWHRKEPVKTKETEHNVCVETAIRTLLKELTQEVKAICYQGRIDLEHSDYGYDLGHIELKNGNLSIFTKSTFDGVHYQKWQTVCFFRGYKAKIDITDLWYEIVADTMELSA